MKKFLPLFFLLILAICLSACQKNSGEQLGVNNGFRRPDFGQPEEKADVRGLVSDILGNEVTVLVMPDRGSGGNQSLTEGEDTETGTIGEKRSVTMNGISGGTGAVARGMGGGFPSGGRPEGRMAGQTGEFNSESMLEIMKEMSTGEEKILIPVGIKMLKFETGEGKATEATEATLEDIKNEKMISIWLNKDVVDRKVAEFVLIMQ